MKRRRLLLSAAALLGAPALAQAQPAGRTYRVGVLTIGTDPKNPVRMEPFFEAMRELNYVEGRNLVVTRGYGGGSFDRAPSLIEEMVKAKVDVILTSGNREIFALKKANVSVPIVMMFVDDPVAEGFVQSLARPGGNITGLTNLVPGLSQKYVELLREIVPKADRFAVVHSPPAPRPHAKKDLEAASQTLNVALSIMQLSTPHEYDGAFAGAVKAGADGIIAPMDGNTFANRTDLVRAVLKHKLPAIYGDDGYVRAGGLMSYSAPQPDRLRRAAVFVDKILRGAKPADLPVEQPTRFELVINMKTAKALGITIPRSLLVRADEVIE